jgi:hypothetical protein
MCCRVLPCDAAGDEGKRRRDAGSVPHALTLRVESTRIETHRIETGDGGVVQVNRLGPRVDPDTAQDAEKTGAGPDGIVPAPYERLQILRSFANSSSRPPAHKPL